MVVRNNELCTFDSLGHLTKLCKLPGEGMEVSAGKFVMYVYDRNKAKQKNAVYLIAPGGKYTKLFETTSPISSLVETGNSLLFTTGRALFSFNMQTQSLKLLAALQGNKEIKSVTVDTANNRIFFSSDSAIYALKETSVALLTDQFGGVLRFYNDGLIVFNPENKTRCKW
jgi:hypothetical protein